MMKMKVEMTQRGVPEAITKLVDMSVYRANVSSVSTPITLEDLDFNKVMILKEEDCDKKGVRDSRGWVEFNRNVFCL